MKYKVTETFEKVGVKRVAPAKARHKHSWKTIRRKARKDKQICQQLAIS